VKVGTTPTKLVDPAPPSILANMVPPSSEAQEIQNTTFTFRAQLMRGLEPGTQIHLPTLFHEWFENTSKYISGFALLPFDDEKGQEIITSDQVPDENPNFYSDYYYNHRV
jgi:hypothetical protein